MKDDNGDMLVHSLTTAKSQTTYLESSDAWKVSHITESVKSKTFEVKDFEARKISITYTGKDFEETFAEVLTHFSIILSSVNGNIFELDEDVKVDVDNTLKDETETKTQD